LKYNNQSAPGTIKLNK